MSVRNVARGEWGFTLVELMLVVALVGILSTLSSFGVRKYVASAKTTEALTNIGGISRAVHAAAARDVSAASTASETSEDKNKGKGNNNGATVVHGSAVAGLCDSADPVPASIKSVAKKKYQPSPADYNTGDQYTGWTCLRFSIESPQMYQYQYQTGGPPVQVTLPKGGNPPGLDQNHTWSAAAQGDLDGNGKTSWFILEGYISDDGQIFQAPGVSVEDPEE